MVPLPRLFSSSSSDDAATSTSSSSTTAPASVGRINNMNSNPANLLPNLANPGSLKAVFGFPEFHGSSSSYEYADEGVPDLFASSTIGSSSSIARRPRLDDSAGEGLRRNVLVRNAMLTSLECERRQLSEETPVYNDVSSVKAPPERNVAVEAMDDEAQFFEDLLSELSGSDSSNSASIVLEGRELAQKGAARIDLEVGQTDDEEDFVQLDSGLPLGSPSPHEGHMQELVAHVRVASTDETSESIEQAEKDESASPALPASLLGSCMSTYSTAPASMDSGFAERPSRAASVSSCCTGYPNVCPYPAVSSFVGTSSEELPALVDDDDSDLDDDEDEVDEHQRAEQGIEPVTEGCGTEQSSLPSQEDNLPLSRPLSPVASPVHSAYADFAVFRDPLSPEHSRPTSPISSASSKGDNDRTSPLLLPTDLGTFPSIAELSLQIPAANGPELLMRTTRALAGTWFDHKHDAASVSSSSADRMRWTTAPAVYYRSAPSASTSTLPDFAHHHRLGSDSSRRSFPASTPNDSTDHSIVVQWSR